MKLPQNDSSSPQAPLPGQEHPWARTDPPGAARSLHKPSRTGAKLFTKVPGLLKRFCVPCTPPGCASRPPYDSVSPKTVSLVGIRKGEYINYIFLYRKPRLFRSDKKLSIAADSPKMLVCVSG